MVKLSKQLELSKESLQFIENLRVYLFSTGKNTEEIEEIAGELEVHLSEAKKAGKPIEKIIGTSPKEYMDMISAEMTIDYRSWIKYIAAIIFGAFSFSIFSELLKGELAYSVLEIIGHIVIGVIFIAMVLTGFKYISTVGQQSVKGIVTLIILAIIPLGLYIGLLLLDRVIDTPVIHFSNVASVIIVCLTALMVIGISRWLRSWIIILLLGLIIISEYVLSFTSFSEMVQLVLEQAILIGGLGLYLWKWNKKLST